MFSGHGQELKVTRTDSLGNTLIEETPFFCPRDAKPFDPKWHTLRGKDESEIASELNLISLNRLISGLDERSNSTRNLLVVDACRNNPAKGKSAGITGSTARNLPKGISILFAAKSGQKSWESTDENIKHGVMTHFLLKGLRGEAKNRRDQLIWSRLISYVQEEVSYDAGKIAGGPERIQSPHAIFNDDQVIVLNTFSKPSLSTWTRYRGPNGSGIANGPAPTQWSPDKNIVWKTKLSGSGISSPIVVGDRVFVTAYSGYGGKLRTMSRSRSGGPKPSGQSDPGDIMSLTRHVICVDRRTGNVLWSRSIKNEVENEDPFEGIGIVNHGYASSTPTSDGELVYVFFAKMGAYAYDMQGRQRWHSVLGAQSDSTKWGSAASPILHKNMLIVSAGAEARAMVALEKTTGKVLWKADAEPFGRSWTTPVIHQVGDQVEIVTTVPGEVWGMNPNNGKLRWFFAGEGSGDAYSSPQLHGGSIFAASGRSGAMNVISGGGKGDISESHRVWSVESLGGTLASPLVYDGRIYTYRRGILTANDGREIAKLRVPETENAPASSLELASPVVAGEHLYCIGRSGEVNVYDVSSNAIPKLVAQNRVNRDTEKTEDPESFRATPAIDDGKFYLRGTKFLYCIGM